jgi:7-keto-8-aminopelargonate synthetase-like enzyme
MTNSSHKILPFLLALALPMAVAAQTSTPAARAAAPARPAPAARPATPAPVARPVVTTPSANQQFQHQVNRQQVVNQQNQNAVRQQLQQNNMNQQRNTATDPGLQSQLDNANRAQQQTYQAQQDATVRNHPTVPRTRDTTRTAPASSGSAGH